MADVKVPRRGSMQFWPRKRARRQYTRVRAWANINDAKPLGFAGYKAGMTHITMIDSRAKSITKGEEIFCPVTVIETPNIKIASIRFYKNTSYGKKLLTEVFSEKLDKELERKISIPKKIKKKIENIKGYDDIKLLVYTQPKLTGIGKKKPEVFEIAVGGNTEQKLNYAKEKLGKEINISEVFANGQQVDIHSVTKGKGFQGPVKRFGVSIRSHKSEKTKRGPGSLGAWCGQGHMMYRVAHAGQMGYHSRREYNKQILKIDTNPNEINPKGGFLHYGLVKNPYMMVKGSIPGPAKRMIRINFAIRPNKKIKEEAPVIQYVSLSSKQ